MKPTQKIIFNTAVLYMKIVICMAISICTVPIVLHSLGESDYGLFNLIAGIISMLAFINGAMTVSTQRYLSVTIGEKDKNKLLQVYNISILLHIIIGLIIVLLIEGSIPILFKYFLNINSGQEDVAHLLFHFLVISMFFSVVTVPFDAVLNSYENMLFFSISGIIEYLLKLAVALSLTLFSSARLEIYGISITLITILVLIIKYVYCRNKYKDLHISPRSCRNKKLFIEMFGFAGWNTLSSLAMVSRNQGIAIILNHFHGTVINAAYGIANQVNAALGYFSSTIQKSINPQLMESEGLHAQERLQNLTFALTKYSVLILGAMSLPVIIELPFITGIWQRTTIHNRVYAHNNHSVSHYTIVLRTHVCGTIFRKGEMVHHERQYHATYHSAIVILCLEILSHTYICIADSVHHRDCGVLRKTYVRKQVAVYPRMGVYLQSHIAKSCNIH